MSLLCYLLTFANYNLVNLTSNFKVQPLASYQIFEWLMVWKRFDTTDIQPYRHEMLSWVGLHGINAHSVSPQPAS